MADQVTASLEQAKVLVVQGLAGKAPRVNATNNHWEVYDNDTQTWVDTGVAATGPAGHSPYINVTGYWVFWNDSTGAWVTTNYKAAGRDGEDGYSPYIGANGHWFAWSEQLAMFDDTGVAAQGDPGTPGTNGFSPVVTITTVTGGHRVTITDENHPQGQSFDVMDGDDYNLTAQDRQEIASQVTPLVPTRIGQLQDDVGLVHYNSQTLTDAQQAQARQNIGAASMSDLGTVFTLKGGVATVNDLPQTGNSIGDVWYVENVSAGFVWITSTVYPNGYWEELGETIDLSNYIEKPSSPTMNYVLTWNGSNWIAAAVPMVTEQDVARWGFTKNTGTYVKPSGGIPKSDLANDVQTSLGKADTAVQPIAISDMATQTWVDQRGYLTLSDLPIYNGGVT